MNSRKSRLKAKDLIRRLTGFSTPFGGVSWEAPASERDEVRAFLTELEDRRVLFNPYDLEIEHWAERSVQEIRQLCTDVLKSLPEKSPTAGPIRVIRAACRRFLDDDPRRRKRLSMHYGRPGTAFFTALGELRAAVGTQIAILAVQHQIELEAELASIVPAEDIDESESSELL